MSYISVPTPSESVAILDDPEDDEDVLVFESNLHKSSNLESMFHIVCVIAGTGLLQIPFALSQSGWLGIFMLCGSAFVNWYTGSV
jgi:Transmembrane amino acid transporter protein